MAMVSTGKVMVMQKDISNLQGTQLNFLRQVMEVLKSTPTAALFLEVGILPIQYEIETKEIQIGKIMIQLK